MYVSSRNELGAILPTAAAIIETGASLFADKPHYAPWGFLYDEYPRKIYEAEAVIRSQTGEPMPPDPDPGNPKPRGGPAYQVAMLAIVPRYVRGSESQIQAYDRRLNEPGGAYERTYQSQLDRLAQLQGRAPTPMPAQITSAVPVSAQIAIPTAIPVTPRRELPSGVPTGMPLTQASMSALPLLAIGGLALVLLMGKGR
jgi:hypothetical protein